MPADAPPPYGTRVNIDSSRMPRLRATSISSLVSIVNVTSPSTSAGVEPGVVERGLHRFARELQLGAARLLRELGLADAGDRGAARQPAGRHGVDPAGTVSVAVPPTCSPSSFIARSSTSTIAVVAVRASTAVTSPV